MKEGDKVYCKKSKDNLYKEGRYYRIRGIRRNSYSYLDKEIVYIDIDSDQKNNDIVFFTFYFEVGAYHSSFLWNFSDYFSLNRVAERRKKLEKLNNKGLWTRIKNKFL